MSVGIQMTSEQMDQTLTTVSIQARNAMTALSNLATQVNGTGNGLAYLEGLGYSSGPNQSNPNNISDAEYALTIVSYFSQISGVYFGTVQSGGAGGTGAILFDIHSALAPLWAGQVT